MKHIVAQNGLSYSIDIVFAFKMKSHEYEWFQNLFGKLVSYQSRINDDGIVVQFTVNANEEISKYGSFKDIPSKTEVKRYLPILLESESFLRSDIFFLRRVIEEYIKKERFRGNNEPPEITILIQEFKNITNYAEIFIKNLALQKKIKKQ